MLAANKKNTQLYNPAVVKFTQLAQNLFACLLYGFKRRVKFQRASTLNLKPVALLLSLLLPLLIHRHHHHFSRRLCHHHHLSAQACKSLLLRQANFNMSYDKDSCWPISSQVWEEALEDSSFVCLLLLLPLLQPPLILLLSGLGGLFKTSV